MSVLSHQSYANLDTPYWVTAGAPAALVSPLSVVDIYGAPTKKVVVTANTNGTGGVFYANQDGANPFGMAFAQGATQPSNQLIFDVGNVLPVMNLTSSNVTTSVPIVIDSPLNGQKFQIIPTPSGVSIQQGVLGVGGSVIDMDNSPAGEVRIMGANAFNTLGLSVVDKVGGEALVESQQVTCSTGVFTNVAKFGVSGTSAYLGNGTNTPAFVRPGVLVGFENGCDLQFRDATLNAYEMKSIAGDLTISAPGDPSAITIAPSGVVTIPNISSGSFVPIGGIVMYSSIAPLPANWKICDGTAGTPDLRDRFIIGAGTFGLGTQGGSTTITTPNLPAHNHGITDPGHNHAITDPGHSHNVVLTGLFNNGDNGTAIVYAGQSLSGSAGNRQSDPGAAQTTTTGITINTGTTGITTTNTGGGTAYYQPYYALAYIIRVA